MPVRRIPINRPTQAHVTAEAISLYQRALQASRGRRRDEYRALALSLHVALGLRPWEPQIFDVRDGPVPFEVAEEPHRLLEWQKVLGLRRLLEAAVAAQAGVAS